MTQGRSHAVRGGAATLAVGCVLVLLEVLPQLASRTSPDVSWLLYTAERMLAGERLYVDLIETNPPLIVWLNLPPVLLSHLLGVPAAALYQLLVAGLGAASVLACAHLLGRALEGETGLRHYVTAATVFVLFPLVRTNFGQREHLALILTLPLAGLAAVRLRRVVVPPRSAIVIGVAAAVGIALKPYFVLPWLALEATVRVGGGQGLKMLPETLAIVATGAIYVVLAILLAPAYWQLAPLIAGAYFDYLRNPLAVTALVGEGAAPVAAVLVIGLLLRRHARHPALWSSLAALTVGYYGAAVAQQKGWEYHFYPAFASSALLLALMAVDVRRPLGTLGRRAAAAAAGAGTATLLAVAVSGCIAQAIAPRALRYELDPSLPALLPIVERKASEGPVMVLSWSAASAYPLIPDAGARSGLRFNFLWMVGSLYGAAVVRPEPLRYRSRAEMSPVERYLNDAVAEDLVTHRPALLIVLAPAPDDPRWGLRRIDLLTYFQRDQRFAAGFSRYRYVATAGQYWVFERLAESSPPAPPRGRVSQWRPEEVAAARQAESSARADPSAV
ncbi:MAG TPA: hypothetical protein VFT84_04140, partial [Gemmatimonadales bacterium]|nr:hypothetical protein [Gemmatimonadales bacterium]